MKWTIILFSCLVIMLVACGKNQGPTESESVAQGNLGLNMNVPNFETNVTHKNGIILIPHSPESDAIIQFERKNYAVDEQKTSSTVRHLIKKLFQHDVDVRPYEQNSAGTYYRVRFMGKFNMDSIGLQFMQVY